MKAVALACCLLASSAAWADATLLGEGNDTSSDRVGRVMAEIGATILGAALPNLLWVPFFFAQQQGPGSSNAPLLVMGMVTVFLEPLSVSTSTWLVHRKMGGQGLWPAAFGGTMLGLALGGALFGVATYVIQNNNTDLRHNGEFIALAAVGALVITAAASVFMIELHNDQTIEATLAPLPGGAAGVITGRF